MSARKAAWCALCAWHAPVSPMVERSRQIRRNSELGIFTTALYSVSGIPRCSLSMSMSLSSKSLILSWSEGARASV